MPHWSAAISTNFFCKGCSWSPSAMPSMVSIFTPSASGASTRQLQTSRPLIVTLQAPQSPEPQPSLLPVSPRLSRRTSSRVWLASQRYSVGAPLMVVLTWILAILAVSPMLDSVDAIARDHRRTLQEHACYLGAVVDGAALVVDRFAGRRTGGRGGIERLVVELGADQRLGRLVDQQHRRRHSAEADTRRSDGITLHAEADADTDNGDVHLGARDQAQVGIARVLGPRRQGEADDDLARLERGLSRAGAELLDRYRALALGALHHDRAASRDQRRHAVGGG